MFNLQGSEIIVILLLALVVLGPEKLPDAIRKFSQTYGELKKMGNGFQSELKSALDEPMREMRETAEVVKRAADPALIAEEAEAEAHMRAEADAAAAAALAAAPDVPIDPAAFGVSDPVAAAEAAAIEPKTAVPGRLKPVSANPADGNSANGKPVNQIALSMARGPIDPEPEVAAAFAPPSGQARTPHTGPAADSLELTAPPSGTAVGLRPPPAGPASDAPPPPPPPPPPPVDDMNVGTS